MILSHKERKDKKKKQRYTVPAVADWSHSIVLHYKIAVIPVSWELSATSVYENAGTLTLNVIRVMPGGEDNTLPAMGITVSDTPGELCVEAVGIKQYWPTVKPSNIA